MSKVIRLNGNWKEGYALDLHTLSSTYIGDDIYGHPQYDTTRSEIGELVYQLKYSNNTSVMPEIMSHIIAFLSQWDKSDEIDFVIPVPPSNKNRVNQPVYLIAENIANYLNVEVDFNFIEKKNCSQVKNLSGEERQKSLSGNFVCHSYFNEIVDILVVDDLFKSGDTLREVCTVLKKDENIRNIYVLTMTKTRNR